MKLESSKVIQQEPPKSKLNQEMAIPRNVLLILDKTNCNSIDNPIASQAWYLPRDAKRRRKSHQAEKTRSKNNKEQNLGKMRYNFPAH